MTPKNPNTTILQSLVDESARRRLEAGWHAGQPVAIESCLPPADHPAYLATLEELVHVELELAWKRWGPTETASEGELPATVPGGLLVEDYLKRFPGLNKPDIVRRLLAQEWRVRHQCGMYPEMREYHGRFPDLLSGLDDLDITLSSKRKALPETPTVPGFEVLGLLGRGGMGVIYQARQLSLNRIVALKMILAGAHADDNDRKRFRLEAEAVARLQHPNIVHIYEIGEHAGRPYLSLEYIEGGNLAHLLAGKPQPAEEAASLVEVLARAMETVHRRGIVHRDLKPANILIQETESDERGAGPKTTLAHSSMLTSRSFIPKITDFGLAKQLEGSAGHTLSGAVLGTPSYMAPEQAAGKKEVGPLADVYALGVILYEMLTGRPPFREATPYDTVFAVLNGELLAPRRLRAEVPRDLETICVKALAKDPAERYASAQALADDLARFRAGAPILARPEHWTRGLARKLRRHIVPVAALLVVLVAVLVASYIVWQGRAAQHTGETAQHVADLQSRFEAGLDARTWSADHLGKMDELLAELATLDAAKAAAARPRLEQRFAAYIGTRIDVPRLLPEDVVHLEQCLTLLAARAPAQLPMLRQALTQRLRLWENVFELKPPFANRALVFDEKFVHVQGQALVPARLPGPSGRRILISKHPCPGNVKLEAEFDSSWGSASEIGLLLDGAPADTGHITALAFSPDGGLLAGASGPVVKFWDAHSGDAQGTIAESGDVAAFAFHPDGKLLATAAGKNVSLWEVSGGQRVKTWTAHDHSVRALAWSADGKYLASGSDDKSARLWELGASSYLAKFDHPLPVVLVGFVSGSDKLVTVTGSKDPTVSTWDLASGSKQAFPISFRLDQIQYAFSSSAGLLAGLTWGPVLPVWEVPSGKQRATLPGRYSRLAFSPDGKVLAKGHFFLTGTPQPITLWDVASGRKVLTLAGHRLDVEAMAFSPDGKVLASAGMDGSLKLWNLPQGNLRLQLGSQAYELSLAVPQEAQAASAKEAPALTLGSVLKSGGTVRLQIVRNGLPLRSHDVRLPAGLPRLKIKAHREGNEFLVQVGDLAPLVFQDLFTVRRTAPGNYGVVVKGEPGLMALHATRQALPPPHSPVEQGDALVARGKFEEAFSYFERQALAAAGTSVALEAQCKAGLCLVQLGRADEAARVLEQVAADPGPRWPLVAACHLWVQRLSQDKADDAETEALFEVVSARLAELVAVIPEEVQLAILQAYETIESDYLAFKEPHLRKLQRAVDVAELFRIPWAQVREMKVGLVHAYWLRGQPDKAQATARAVVSTIRSFPRAKHTLEESRVLAECLWILRRRGDAAALVKEVDDMLFDKPGVLVNNPRFTRAALIERARLHAALKNFAQVDKDLDTALALPRPENLHAYAPHAAACLIKGFLAQERGDAAGAQAWWRRGLFNTWKKELFAGPTPAVVDVHAILDNLVMASLTGELAEADAQKTMEHLTVHAGHGSTADQLLKAFPPSPASLREMWRDARGRDWARKIAFRELELDECLKVPVYLAAFQVLRQGAFPEKIGPEQDALLWQTAQAACAAHCTGVLSGHQVAQLGRAWKGTTGLLGWGGVAPKLKPELRGPLAWAFAHRFQARGDAKTAATLFRTALEDCAPNSPLHRLAKAEVERAGGE